MDASKLKNAVEYLSSPPYLSTSSSGEKTEDELLLQLFNIDNLVSGWLTKCQEGLPNWNSWISQCEGLMNQAMCEINTLGFATIEQLYEEYKKIELSKPKCITGFDGFIVFGDCVKWILDFYQVNCSLHSLFLTIVSVLLPFPL
jgi:hypothetical protein